MTPSLSGLVLLPRKDLAVSLPFRGGPGKLVCSHPREMRCSVWPPLWDRA
jgi:hypothetical protein